MTLHATSCTNLSGTAQVAVASQPDITLLKSPCNLLAPMLALWRKLAMCIPIWVPPLACSSGYPYMPLKSRAYLHGLPCQQPDVTWAQPEAIQRQQSVPCTLLLSKAPHLGSIFSSFTLYSCSDNFTDSACDIFHQVRKHAALSIALEFCTVNVQNTSPPCWSTEEEHNNHPHQEKKKKKEKSS